MGDDGRDQDGIGLGLQGGIDQLVDGAGGAQIVVFDAVALDSPVLDVQDLLQADRMLVLPHCSRYYCQGLLPDILPDFSLGQGLDNLGQFQSGQIDVKADLALHFDVGPLGRVHDLAVDDLAVGQSHLLSDGQGGHLRMTLVAGQHHGQDKDPVGHELHLRPDELGIVVVFLSFGDPGLNIVVVVQLVDELDLGGVLEGIPADGFTGAFELFRNIVVAEMNRDRGKIIRGPKEKAVISDAAFRIPGDAVPLAVGVLGAVDKEAFLDGIEIAAGVDDLLHEEDGPLLQLPDPVPQGAVPLDLHHLADAVQA